MSELAEGAFGIVTLMLVESLPSNTMVRGAP